MALSADEPFERPSGPWKLSLPSDHGARPGMRAETWMIAAHLLDDTGGRTGATFSLSRFGLHAEISGADSSPWDFRAFYRAHVTLAKEGATVLHAEEHFSRGAGAAGHDPNAREVWLDNWILTYGHGPDGRGLTLTASVDGVPIRLDLSPVKAATLSNENNAPP